MEDRDTWWVSGRWIAAGVAAFALVLLAVGPTAAAPRYEIDLIVDWDTGTFAGTTRVTVENRTPAPIDEIVFRLFPNDAIIYGNASLRVREARIAGGPITIAPSEDPTVLPILLPSPLGPAQTVSLTLAFAGRAGASPQYAGQTVTGYGILTKNPQSLVLTAFYPILAVLNEGDPADDAACSVGDVLWSESADYDVTVSVPNGIIPAATGRLVSTRIDGGRTIHRFEATSARDFSLVLTLGYEERSTETHGKIVRSWFSPSNRAAAERARATAVQTLDLFEARIGSLPVAEIDLVEVPLHRAAGVELSGLILIASSFVTHPSDIFYDIIVAHEMAHQWFYGVVGNDPVSSPWLDEGLATYLSNVYLESTGQDEAAHAETRRWQSSYASTRASYPDSRMSDSACRFPTASAYTTFVYDAAAWFHYSVRAAIGDEAYFAALSAFFATHTFKVASGNDLLAAFRDASGVSLDALFAEFGVESR